MPQTFKETVKEIGASGWAALPALGCPIVVLVGIYGGICTPNEAGAIAVVYTAREEKILTMEQAIRKMTSFPAHRYGLEARGILRDAMKADIVVFDPLTVTDTATFAKPKQFPLSIEYLFVNGKMVVEKGRHTGALPGEPIKIRGYVRGK